MSAIATMPVPKYPTYPLLDKETVSTELRYFADRSLYDAIATLYFRAGVKSKRFTRNYTLESVQAASDGSLYEYCPDSDEVSLVPEYAVGALDKLVQGHWEALYSGIRDSYLLVNKETGNVEVYLDMQTNESNNVVNIVAYGLIPSCNYLPTLDRMDDALLRQGRMYKALEFRMFARSEVNDIRVAAGKEPLSDEVLETRADWTLANIIYAGENNHAQKYGVGFGLVPGR